MKVGDYVRTKKGILKIRDDKPFKDDKNKLNYLTYGNYTCVLKENIIKSSPNIIDLIEVGDVITTNNLCGEITKIDGDKIYTTCYDGEYCSASDIKTIVTHEQFKSMEYEVK